MAVMGKTLEHLGSQLYRRRDAAIAELVANSWDAGAKAVWVDVPDVNSYDQESSEIRVTDSGGGMIADEVEEFYLKVGRNRRQDQMPPPGRKVMGRKGIGKLAGFGIATEVELVTWRDASATRVTLPIEKLKQAPGALENVDLEGEEGIAPPDDVSVSTGTRIILRGLRHVTPVVASDLRASLGRRFSRTIRGEMDIHVNGEIVGDPDIELEHRVPKEGWEEADVDGNAVRYFYGFSPTVLTPSERRGFVIYLRGKTGQAPPFFFDVEATATGQHGTKYLHGAIEADFLDDDDEDAGDVLSTDRQEIDWEMPVARELKKWGDSLTRKALRELRERREDRSENWVLADPRLSKRLSQLDKHSKLRVTSFVRTLGRTDDVDRDRVLRLAGGLVSAFEYQHFHDLLGDIEEVGDDPERLADLLERILSWKTLESRAILEVVEGRLRIVDKFHEMVVTNAPETAPQIGLDNLHDLLTSFPWLLNAEWQTFEHERNVTAQIRAFAESESKGNGKEDGSRVDFLALSDGKTLFVVEIKRPKHGTSLEEFQRLQSYMDRLRPAWEARAEGIAVKGLLVATDLDFDEGMLGPNVTWERWADLYGRVRTVYEHYRSVLEQDIESRGFHEKELEIAATKKVLRDGSYLEKSEGKPDLGPSDVTHDETV